MTDKRVIYQFDDVRVEPDSLRVYKAGQVVPLEPKAFEVLLFLLEHRGSLVEKNEILDAVWRQTFVTPNAMTRVIAQLRRGLGDDARESRYIETVPTRGYRFIAEVEARRPDDPGRQRNAVDQDARQTLPPVASIAAEAGPARSGSPKLIMGMAAVAVLLLMATAGIFWARRSAWSDDWVEVRNTAQLTTSPGLDIFPAFAPDGNSIAYASDRSGAFEIYIKPLAPGGREVQVTSNGGDNLQPTWSADGKLLAYHSRQRGGIWAVPALGGVATQLSGFGSAPSWSRDGKWVVFQSDVAPDLSQAAYGAMPPSTIWVVPATGGAPRQVTKIGQPSGGHGSPTWAPDGRRIVFVTSDIGLSELWSVAPDGGDLKRLNSDQWRGTFYNPIISPDGKFLYVATGSGNFRLWQVRLDNNGNFSGRPIQLQNTGASLARHLSIAPDGKRIVYSALSMSNNIGSVVIDRDTGEAAGEPTLLTQDTNYRKTSHGFSPDGRRIGYNVWRMGAEGEVWVMDADGKNARQMTIAPAAFVGWLPGGDRLATIDKSHDDRRLWAVELESGRRTPLSDRPIETGLGRLSPDGKVLAVNSRQSGTINVWTFAINGGELKQLTFDREMMGFPCWSPDGKWIAIEVKRGSDTHLAVIPSNGPSSGQTDGEGREVEVLTSEPGQSWPGSWGPDRDRIAFAGQRRGIWNIYWVARGDRQMKRVTGYQKPNTYVRYPAWSPRGDQIIYEYAETRGNVWMLTFK